MYICFIFKFSVRPVAACKLVLFPFLLCTCSDISWCNFFLPILLIFAWSKNKNMYICGIHIACTYVPRPGAHYIFSENKRYKHNSMQHAILELDLTNGFQKESTDPKNRGLIQLANGKHWNYNTIMKESFIFTECAANPCARCY